MVLQKRLDYGFYGYQVPPTPRAARSARRRRCFKKGSEDNQILPFDLLAIVAGKLLLEKDSSTSSGAISANKDQLAVASDNAKNKWEDKGKPLEVEAQDNESPASNFLVSKLVSQVQAQNSSSEENDMKLGLVAPITNSDCMESFNAEQLVNRRGKDDMRTPNSKVEVALSSYKECGDYCKLKDQTTRLIKDESHRPANVLNNSEAVTCYSDDLWLCNRKPALVSLHCSAKVPLRGNNLIPNTSCPVIQDNVNISSRDDDENSSGCTHPSTTKKFFRSAPCIGDRRIRKILASKYWKVAQKLKDVTLSKIDGNRRSAYFRRKNSYKYQSSEKLYPFKKRKYFGYNSPSNSDGGISSKIFLDSPRLGNSGDASGFFQKMHGATGPSVVDQNTSFQPRDPHVKLRIKSFRVPELFIEIPESGTIGSLKRAVMEALTAILRGGLRVGVLLHGKKVKDDNKTLMQTGISHHNQLDAIGFSLEPNHPQPSASLHHRDSLFLLPCEGPQPLRRHCPTSVVLHPGTCATSAEPHAANSGNLVESDHDSTPHAANSGNLVESDHDSTPSATDMSVDNSTTNVKALATVPAMNVNALAVVPAHRKPKGSEIARRRIRRPFSVAEVEALVQAVEKLGTGRFVYTVPVCGYGPTMWRDVKLQAFDDAKHRTYVDLKDKWKTLVHTARISPQQRRGEPVPQELLDRVLTAHAYWSEQQAKEQLKHQLSETCLLL